MKSFRPLPEWPRALSARRLVLLATVAGLGVAGAAIGPYGFSQGMLPSYSAYAAESMLGWAVWPQPSFCNASMLSPLCSLAASLDFACWVTKLVEIPGADFCLRFGFGCGHAFLSMGHLARTAFKYVQIG